MSELAAIAACRTLIENQIRSREREHADTEPPVSESDCATLIADVERERENVLSDGSSSDFAAIETVCRDILYDRLRAASSNIDNDNASLPAYVWYLLDITIVLSDRGLCEQSLCLWLVEELLDSRTIDECRSVFDYLESRRERITSKNFMKSKSLAMLRLCNELLRRLSRAEDTVFCGRVFIFLFQSFPLGDRSAINLRGEFHVENVTDFDSAPQKSEYAIKPMEIDTEGGQPVTPQPQTPASSTADLDKTARSTPSGPKALVSKTSEEPADLDSLYPIFWSLQSVFSSPTRLFEPAIMSSFKSGIGATLSVFQKMQNTSSSSASSSSEIVKRGTKRKRSENDPQASVSNTFNPKYLTNRDLFDLEVHDISFRRHILVQAHILLDFILSLSPHAKAKLADLKNKSVLYDYTLSEEDAKWASMTRSNIASYLEHQGSGTEGKFYYRMVNTVLSRDKNWVRWKAEACPSISRPPVDVNTHIEAQNSLKKLCKTHDLPPPPGAENLAFLAKSEPMEALKNPAKKHRIPTMEEFYKGIQNDELDAEMGTAEEIEIAHEAKEAKVWRALRASGRRFTLCEKIQNGKNLKALVGQEDQENVPPAAGQTPEDAGGLKESDADEQGEHLAEPEAMET